MTDSILIFGMGLAGLATALQIQESIPVHIYAYYDSNSDLAQGGIAACWSKADSCKVHIEDTLRAGHHINDREAVHSLAWGAPDQIRFLEQLGVVFDKDEACHHALTLEGGHTNPRIHHIKGDKTGHGIMKQLMAVVEGRRNITIHRQAMLLELIVTDESIWGARIYEDGIEKVHRSQRIVMATGGVGDLYRHTTNQPGMNGLGMMLAADIGAKLRDLCYVQFHPTAFYEEHANQCFLISEAVRGEGAVLVNSLGSRIMKGRHSMEDLAPRDVVAAAIHDELIRTGKPQVYLDTRMIKGLDLKRRFPTIWTYLKKKGYELGNDLIPVVPVAHYTVGGIKVDLRGQTSIEGLYACGEVASTGIHGANRLASNSLMECLIYGKKIAGTINMAYDSAAAFIQTAAFEPEIWGINSDMTCDTAIHIKSIMSDKVGILRDEDHLLQARDELMNIVDDLRDSYRESLGRHKGYYMGKAALEIVKDALRQKSLGCHQLINEGKESHIS